MWFKKFTRQSDPNKKGTRVESKLSSPEGKYSKVFFIQIFFWKEADIFRKGMIVIVEEVNARKTESPNWLDGIPTHRRWWREYLVRYRAGVSQIKKVHYMLAVLTSQATVAYDDKPPPTNSLSKTYVFSSIC